MQLPRRAALAAPALLALPAAAQDSWPTRPVRFLVPFPPGQATDLFARVMADELSRRWPQRAIVENRSGGAGAIGMEAAARSPADGYTIAVGSSGTVSTAPAMVPNLPYDPVRDFVAISMLAVIPLIWVCHPSLPTPDIRAFVARAREQTVDYASGGPGSTQHFGGELFRHELRLRLNHISYRGSAPAMTDLLAGVVPAMVDSVANSLPHIRAGRVRALAVLTRNRVPWLPDVPTVAETVIPDFEVIGWAGLMAPAGTPAPITARLNADIRAALAEPAVANRIAEMGGIAGGNPQAEFAAYVASEAARWRQVVRDANIRVEG